MNKRFQGLVRQSSLVATLIIVVSSAALAFGVTAGSWKVVDGGKTVRQRAKGQLFAIIQNNGPDAIDVSAKGTFEIFGGQLLPGTKASLVMPKGAKKVKFVDANPGNGVGSKGTLVWAQKISASGKIIDTKPK